MHINPSHHRLHPPHGATTGPGQNTQGGSSSGMSSRVVSSTLQELQAALQQVPEVRQDVLAAAASRYAQGALLTPAALQDTVTAMLERF